MLGLRSFVLTVPEERLGVPDCLVTTPEGLEPVEERDSPLRA